MDEQQLEQRLNKGLRAHPRLLWLETSASSVPDRIAADPTLEETWQKVREAADGMLDVPLVEREVIGRRMLGVSRQCLKRVLYLGSAWRITGEHRYFEKAKAELLTAAAFSDWNPSHFLDVAEMTAALAIGYDWFFAELDDESRETLRTAIIDKGLTASFEHRWPVAGAVNWNPVCHGSLVLGALAIAEFEPALAARVIARAVENVPHAMVHYQPDGAYPEGPTYWDYGTSFNVLLIDALEQALGDSCGLLEQPGFLDTADYLLHVTGPTGAFFNYGDSGSDRMVAVAQAWLAQRRDAPYLARDEARALHAMGPIDPANERHRLLPLMLIWSPSLDSLSEPDGRSYLGRGGNPVAMHRSAWRDDAVFVGLKGGIPGWSHGHMDVGTFVLDADGVRWSVDLGAQTYHDLEARGMHIWTSAQDSDRWKIFRYNNRAHSTLTVDDQFQRADGSAPIIRHVNAGADTPAHTVIDMSEVYQEQLTSARRGVMLLTDGQVLVQDEVQAPKTKDDATTVRWVVITPGELEATGPGKAALTADGQRLHLRLLGLDDPPMFTTWSLEPPNAWDAANPGKRRVGFELRLQPGEEAAWGVLLTPGSIAKTSPDVPTLRALADWSPPLEE